MFSRLLPCRLDFLSCFFTPLAGPLPPLPAAHRLSPVKLPLSLSQVLSLSSQWTFIFSVTQAWMLGSALLPPAFSLSSCWELEHFYTLCDVWFWKTPQAESGHGHGLSLRLETVSHGESALTVTCPPLLRWSDVGTNVAATQSPHLLKLLQRHVFHCSGAEFRLPTMVLKTLCDLVQCISSDYFLPLPEGHFVRQSFWTIF